MGRSSEIMGRPSSRLRIGVIGLGHFAQAAVLPAIAQLDDVEIAALVSGSRHKLDELLGDGGVDAVYIAVPNDLHSELTVIAARSPAKLEATRCEHPRASRKRSRR